MLIEKLWGWTNPITFGPEENGRKRRAYGDAVVIRYADDKVRSL